MNFKAASNKHVKIVKTTDALTSKAEPELQIENNQILLINEF